MSTRAELKRHAEDAKVYVKKVMNAETLEDFNQLSLDGEALINLFRNNSNLNPSEEEGDFYNSLLSGIEPYKELADKVVNARLDIEVIKDRKENLIKSTNANQFLTPDEQEFSKVRNKLSKYKKQLRSDKAKELFGEVEKFLDRNVDVKTSDNLRLVIAEGQLLVESMRKEMNSTNITDSENKVVGIILKDIENLTKINEIHLIKWIEIDDKIKEVKATLAENARQIADADAELAEKNKQIKEIDEELVSLGIDPEKGKAEEQTAETERAAEPHKIIAVKEQAELNDTNQEHLNSSIPAVKPASNKASKKKKLAEEMGFTGKFTEAQDALLDILANDKATVQEKDYARKIYAEEVSHSLQIDNGGQGTTSKYVAVPPKHASAEAKEIYALKQDGFHRVEVDGEYGFYRKEKETLNYDSNGKEKLDRVVIEKMLEHAQKIGYKPVTISGSPKLVEVAKEICTQKGIDFQLTDAAPVRGAANGR